MEWTYEEANRAGDHIWYISDLSRFRRDYPQWNIEYDVPEILQEIYEANVERWQEAAAV